MRVKGKLLTIQHTSRGIVEAGGEALVQVKGNQPSALAAARAIAESRPPLLPWTR